MQKIILILLTLCFASHVSAANKVALGTAKTELTQTNLTKNQVTKVNINKADSKALMQITGINHYKVQKLIAYRKAHGDFASVAEVQKVPGFKRLAAGKLTALTDQMSLN